jgi:hypothetical protein
MALKNGDPIATAQAILPRGDLTELNRLLSNWLLQERCICQQKKDEVAGLQEIIEAQSSGLSSTLARLERKVTRMEKRLGKSTIMAGLDRIDRVSAKCAKLDKDMTALCRELSNLSEEWQGEFNTLSKRMAKTYAASQLWREAIDWASKKLAKPK